MKLTIDQAIEAIVRDGSPEAYAKRMNRIRRLSNERDDLMNKISVFDRPEEADKRAKCEKRLQKVLQMIEELR